MTAVFAAIIMLLNRLVHAWFFSKEEPERFDDRVGDNTLIETKGPYRIDTLTLGGEMNHATGKVDSGMDPYGWYEDD